ncbi:DsrE family protein [Alteromonas sp. A079]|uniref:DsrE family protein n=1 Tax=Alteromonas sp. A079 TaxID=3410268 RepID=UPI003B9F2642
MATLLICFTHPPYGSNISQEGLDFALAATNFGHSVSVLFKDDGVLQLVKSDSIKGIKNHSKRLASMPFFDIESCFVCELSASRVGHDISGVMDAIDAEFANADEQIRLISSSDHVVTF